MKNIDRIKQMSAGELTDYIFSVFLTGKLSIINPELLNSIDNNPINYNKWLLEEI